MKGAVLFTSISDRNSAHKLLMVFLHKVNVGGNTSATIFKALVYICMEQINLSA